MTLVLATGRSWHRVRQAPYSSAIWWHQEVLNCLLGPGRLYRLTPAGCAGPAPRPQLVSPARPLQPPGRSTNVPLAACINPSMAPALLRPRPPAHVNTSMCLRGSSHYFEQCLGRTGSSAVCPMAGSGRVRVYALSASRAIFSDNDDVKKGEKTVLSRNSDMNLMNYKCESDMASTVGTTDSSNCYTFSHRLGPWSKNL